MNKEETKAWVVIDDHDMDIIVGNRKGLKQLLNAIQKAMDGEEVDFTSYVDDSSISRIFLKSKDEYLNSIPEYKETFGQKIIEVLLFIWFLALPIVAIALIIYLVVN